MKKRSALIFGLLAVVLVFSLVLAGCKDTNGGGGGDNNGSSGGGGGSFSLSFTGAGSDTIAGYVYVFTSEPASSTAANAAVGRNEHAGYAYRARASDPFTWVKIPSPGTYTIVIVLSTGYFKKKTSVTLSAGSNSVDYSTFTSL